MLSGFFHAAELIGNLQGGIQVLLKRRLSPLPQDRFDARQIGVLEITMTQTTDFDLSFRPTYFPESRTPEQLLANIKGKARRDIAREVLEMEGCAGLTAFLGRETLEEPDRQAWGAVC